MHVILKTYPPLDYLELWIAPSRVGPATLRGHFNLPLGERNLLIDALRIGIADLPMHSFEVRNRIVEHVDPQAEVDQVFEEAARGQSPNLRATADPLFEEAVHQGASPEPLTPVTIPDPVGKLPLIKPTGVRTPRPCCDSFVGDPHTKSCEFAGAQAAGRDGSKQAALIRAYREETRASEFGGREAGGNAQQGGAIASGEANAPTPLVRYRGARFIAVCDVFEADEEYRWNVCDTLTRRYRMPGFTLDEGTAKRSAERANADPDQYASRFVWNGKG